MNNETRLYAALRSRYLKIDKCVSIMIAAEKLCYEFCGRSGVKEVKIFL